MKPECIPEIKGKAAREFEARIRRGPSAQQKRILKEVDECRWGTTLNRLYTPEEIASSLKDKKEEEDGLLFATKFPHITLKSNDVLKITVKLTMK